jgi:hypothetical protein
VALLLLAFSVFLVCLDYREAKKGMKRKIAPKEQEAFRSVLF